MIDVTIAPSGSSWLISGPAPWLGSRTIASPLADRSFRGELAELREWSCRPVRRGDPQAPGTEEFLRRLARQVSGPLEAVLFPEEVRDAVLSQVSSGGALLMLRVTGRGALSDRVLALPWELVGSGLPGPRFQVVREAVTEGAPELPEQLPGPLSVAACIAAPEDRSVLAYEEEALRLQVALASLGHQVSFADLGRIQDLVELAEAGEPRVLHFSGHGRDERLVFEDALGLAEEIPVEELVRQLRLVLLNPARRGRFPTLFFLSSRGAATAGPAAEPSDLEAGPSVAGRLHRAGFAQVVGFFGPVDGELASRVEEVFYGTLARGATVLEAAAAARVSLAQPLGEPGGERWYPLGGALLTVYQRDSGRSLVDRGASPASAAPVRGRAVELSGLPVLERGLIGRRGEQHEILRRVQAGQRLLVLQGLGGLGKTALATQMMARVLAPEEAADRLILRCRDLPDTGDPLLDLWAQAEEHGTLHGLPGWSGRARYLRASVSGAAEGLAAAIREIQCDRPHLVTYLDNAESLQVGPRGHAPNDPGSWRPGLEGWWVEIERIAEEGALVLVSTRYAWAGLGHQAHLAVGPLSEADTWRLIESFDELARLPREVRLRLVRNVDGHPRTIELLDRLVGLRVRALGRALRDEEMWTEVIEPILPHEGQLLREDLLLETLWELLPEEARGHARRLGLLRQPAPVWVVDRLGSDRDALIRASLLTRYREAGVGSRVRWVDRWGLHGLVREQVTGDRGEESREAGHRAAGEAWAEWLQRPGWLRADQREAAFHLHAAREADRSWPIVQDHAHWLRTQGRYQEAQLLLEESIAAGVQGTTLALALILLANVRTVQGDPGVEPVYQQVLAWEIPEALRAEALHEYAVFLDLASHYDKAEAMVRRALEIKRSCPGLAAHEIGVTLVLLGRVLESLGRLAEAEAAFAEALAILREAPEEIRPQLSVGLHSLARVLDKQGHLAEAEALFRESSQLDRLCNGDDDPQYAVALQSLGWILVRQEKAEEAEGWLRKALEILERTFSRDHPETATTRLTLGRALAQEERDLEAEELFREVVEIDRRTLAVDHPERSHGLSALGGLLFKQGRHAEAEPLIREALALQENVLRGKHFGLVSPPDQPGGCAGADGSVLEPGSAGFLTR
jgi:tetratricopeptide (TPR) repeat protein